MNSYQGAHSLGEGAHLARAVSVGVSDVLEAERERHEVDAEVDHRLHYGPARHVAGQFELPQLKVISQYVETVTFTHQIDSTCTG